MNFTPIAAAAFAAFSAAMTSSASASNVSTVRPNPSGRPRLEWITDSEIGMTRTLDAETRLQKVNAINSYLKHIYAVYLGLRSCSEINRERADGSFAPTVSLEDARQVLRLIDIAASQVAIKSEVPWAEVAPKGLVTAEALKTNVQASLPLCRKMGDIFRVDEANLQNLLTSVGAKQILILKDY